MKKVKIGNIAKIFNGYAFKSTEYTDSGFQVIRITNVQNGYISNDNKKYIELKNKSLERFILNEGDILISLTGNVGRVGKIGKVNLPAVLNQRVGKVIIQSKEVIPDYLFQILKSNVIESKLTENAKGIAQKNIGSLDIENIEIPLPPLEDQSRIVKILDEADVLRQKRKQAIGLLDDYLKSVFLEMFGDPVKNEKGWPTQKFEKLGTLDRGKSKHRPRNAPELLGGEHPLIQTGDVANANLYIENYNSTYSDFGLKQSKKWPKGTLCITIAANIAKTGILNFDACFPDSVVGFVANTKKTNTVYIHFWMSFFQKILEANAPESAQKNINLRILRDLDVISPSLELQNKFSEIVKKTEYLKQSMLTQSAELETQFQALMQKAFF